MPQGNGLVLHEKCSTRNAVKKNIIVINEISGKLEGSSFKGVKCNLGKVNLESKMVNMVSCLTWLGVVQSQVVPIFCPPHPSLSSFEFGEQWFAKHSTEWFSVTVPGGDHWQGCHGYLMC